MDPAVAPVGVATTTWRRALAAVDWRMVAGILALYALSRAALMAVATLTLSAVDPAAAAQVGDGPAQVWCRWDCGWYLAIAEHGYSAQSDGWQPGATRLAFFPLLPLLIRGLVAVTGLGYVGAGIVVANLAFLAALAYLFRYVLLLGFTRPVAWLTVALLCFVPQGFVFSAVYTESLFLLLLAACLFHVRRGEYLRAGLAAALLSAVRANGVLVLAFLLAWIVRRFGAPLLWTPWRRPEVFIPVLLAPLGLFAFWAFCFQFTGDAFAQASSIGHGWGWQRHGVLDNLRNHFGIDATARFWALSSLVVAALSLLLLPLRLYEEFLLCAALLLLMWSGSIPNSLLRYAIVLFPVWIALARFIAPRPVAIAATFGLFALFNGFLMTAWTLGRPITI